MTKRTLALSILGVAAVTSIATSPPMWSADATLETQRLELLGAAQLETTYAVSSTSDDDHGVSPFIEASLSEIELVNDSGEPFAMVLAIDGLDGGADEARDRQHVYVSDNAPCDDASDCAAEFTLSIHPARELVDGERAEFDLDVAAWLSGTLNDDDADPVVDLELQVVERRMFTALESEIELTADQSEVVLLQVDAETIDVPVELSIQADREILELALSQDGEVIASGPSTEPLVIPACDSGSSCTEGYVLEFIPQELAPMDPIAFSATVSVASADLVPFGSLSVAEVEMGL